MKTNRLHLLALFLIIFVFSSAKGQISDYHGFECKQFEFEGHQAKLVVPKNAEPGRHWIWRARFWGHEPQTEIALLNKGFHVAFIDAPELCGGPKAVELWDHFYDYLITNYQLNKKVVLEGMSRGGLYIYNWGSANPEKVACIYADAPVCDLRSWPGGKGKGVGSPADWQLHLRVYGLDETTVNDFKGMPIYNCVSLAKAKVPVLHVCGATDDVVPMAENTSILEKNFREAGGDIKVIVKEGIGHHPHSLKDPTAIVTFILRNTNPELLDKPETREAKMAITYRGIFNNSRLKFEKEKVGRVAFMGGSITEGAGWRDLVCDYLTKRFPETRFEFIAAGISSTGSTPGAMRFKRDVAAYGPIDLFFEEAAVNDATNGFPVKGQIRGMEGIIAQAIKSNPKMDIVMMHFVDQDKMADYNNGKIPEVIQSHEKVAERYSIPTINLAKEVNDRILNGEFTWKDDFKNLHPSPFGHKLYFETIRHFLETAWKKDSSEVTTTRKLPSQPVDAYSYTSAGFESVDRAKLIKGFTLVPKWKPTDGVSARKRDLDVPVLEATQPGAKLQYAFTGKAIGIYITSGPDAGILEYRIDNGPLRTVDQFTSWSKSLHLPWIIMLDDELKEGKHVLELTVSQNKNGQSNGTACRIQQFAVNK